MTATCHRPFQSVALTNPTTTTDVTNRNDDDNNMSLACFLLHQMCGICVGDYQSRAIILDDYDGDVVVHPNNSIVDDDYYNYEDDIIEYGLEIVDYDEILKTLTSYGRNHHHHNSKDYEEEIRQLRLQQKEHGLLKYHQSEEVPVEESKEDEEEVIGYNDSNRITGSDDFKKEHRLTINEAPSEESHTIPSTNTGVVTNATKTGVLLEEDRVSTPLRYNSPRIPPPKRQSSRVASE